MRTILIYLKAFIMPLILAILLLFVQAYSDLSLPNYMSDIVDVGIQQNGVNHSTPNAVSEDGFRFITTFMTNKDKAYVESKFKIVVPTGEYKNAYPKSAGRLYVLKEINTDELSKLDSIFNQASIDMLGLLSILYKDAKSIDEPVERTKLDMAKAYELQPILDEMPENKLLKNNLMGDENKIAEDQVGISINKSFMEELGIDITTTQTKYIIKMGLIMLGITLIGGFATIMVSFLSSRIAAGISRNIRQDVFTKIESFSFNEIDKFSTASLITRSTNDIIQIQNFFMFGIRMLCYAPIIGVGGVIMAMNKAASMSWIIGLAVVFLLLLIILLMIIAIPKFKIIQKLIDRVNLVSREYLSGLMVVRAFRTGDHEKARFEEANNNLTKTQRFINRTMALMPPIMMLIMNGVSILIVWIGAHKIAGASMQVGDMMAFIQYTMQIIMAFLMMSMIFIMIPRAAVSASRLSEILNTNITIENKDKTKNFNNTDGKIVFNNVSFRYENASAYALKDINVTIEPGHTTALIGSTGAGKSTFVNLLLRLYDVSSGEVLVDDLDVRDADIGTLRDKFALVPQKASLFEGTIASNVRIGNEDASDEKVIEALTDAQAMEFVNKLEDGIESHVSQGGSNLSGGQKQRISIARALLKEKEFLIFDDSFSALDLSTERKLRNSLLNGQDVTTFIVAQRVTSILNADQIIVLDQGEIVGLGTHNELIKNCDVYYDIASSQLTKEELDA
ncbi:ABC transporter ATP-binding protein [Phocicoccus pinnipedialis]|uniref:Vitamin B12 import ATP-binding protein BtuD n=1 Tax=Phocicoccus pinnipedialis TaxID=110845 RepID=A0A6V7REW2_9BACL|nr:ABC transporter ATP-binding protein [Jeotgalicoccus pinnipedialis]MBP1939425.1 ATP-binding cassette subfamily B protein [Jeotgalicoccus pinnipedialis]CAD2075446.1 Vitamin B12 import ATP-binding protein BtuD [Jeotgalicoccus pinnipedialis]